MSIIALLAALAGAAVSAARTSSKKQQTLQTIAKLDALVRQQFTSYSSRGIPTPSQLVLQATKMTASQYRAWYIRRNIIAGDLPDRWSDIAVLATGTASVTASGTVRLPITASQRTYAAVVRESLKKRGNTNPTASEIVAEANRLGTTYSGAECLFLIIMQGGFADCVDCGELKSSPRGDRDGDGAFEFWDAWGNPIGFLLWPAAVELPAGRGVEFFAASGPRGLTPPFEEDADRNGLLDANEDMNQNQVLDRATPSCGMVPLIYSAGPDGYTGPNDDGTCGYDCGDLSQANLTLLLSDITPVGRDCGNWTVAPTNTFGKRNARDALDYRSDNITNLDLEALIK